jgi:hypothetical protein
MCKFCHDVHWKYNMRHHLQEQHPSWESNTDSLEVQDFSGKISITNEEETKLGIPEESHSCCVVAINAYDVQRSHSLLHIHNSHGKYPCRPHYTMPVLEQFQSSILSYNNDVFS